MDENKDKEFPSSYEPSKDPSWTLRFFANRGVLVLLAICIMIFLFFGFLAVDLQTEQAERLMEYVGGVGDFFRDVIPFMESGSE